MAIGSMYYMSANANKGYEQSRRDDLESLGYLLIFLANGDLPWRKIKHLNINKEEKYDRVLDLKKALSGKELCEGLPEEFAKYINYCRKLYFEEDPNYDYLRSLFSSILKKNQEKNDFNFFWIIKANRINKNEERKLGNLPNINKRKESSKNRLFRKIKNSLEKSENRRNSIQNNNLNLEHIKSLNLNPIEPIHQKTKYSNNEIRLKDGNLKIINKDEQIMNKNIITIDYQTKYNLSFKKNENKNSDIKNQNSIKKYKSITIFLKLAEVE